MAKNSRPTEAPRDTQTVASLEQIRALADPLRLRILSALVREPRTTKQVAGLLGEKHTRLYHHVQALERVRLIRLTGTKRKRGTTERYYQATAKRFEAAASVFSADPGAGAKHSELEAMLNALLDAARVDLRNHMRTSGATPLDGKKGLLAARLLIPRSSPQKVQSLRRQLIRMLKKLRTSGSKGRTRHGATTEKGQRTYAITVILSPTDEI